jgi:hypothetical protein
VLRSLLAFLLGVAVRREMPLRVLRREVRLLRQAQLGPATEREMTIGVRNPVVDVAEPVPAPSRGVRKIGRWQRRLRRLWHWAFPEATPVAR